MSDTAFVRMELIAPSDPPPMEVGVVGWIRGKFVQGLDELGCHGVVNSCRRIRSCPGFALDDSIIVDRKFAQ